MKLTETTLIIEEINGEVRIKNRVLELDKPTNTTGRLYSTKMIENSLVKAQPNFKLRNLLGTLKLKGENPEELPDPLSASHVVINSWIEDGYLWAESIILVHNHKGKLLLDLLKNNKHELLYIGAAGIGGLNGGIVNDYEYLGFNFYIEDTE